MEIHHDKHHAAYVTNLNAALKGTEWMDQADRGAHLEPRNPPGGQSHAVRNNGGGHANHTLFWEIMGPDGGGEPVGRRSATAIAAPSAAFAELKEQVNDAGAKRFGSGWGWLVCDGTASR